MTDLAIDFDTETGTWDLAAPDAQGDLREDPAPWHVDALLVLISAPGHWRMSPATGVRLAAYTNADNPEGLRALIQEQMELDGLALAAPVRLETSASGDLTNIPVPAVTRPNITPNS